MKKMFEDKLYDLISTKSYDDLSDEEQTYVKSLISETEYRELNQLQYDIVDEEQAQDYKTPDLKEDLMLQAEQSKRKGIVRSLWSSQIKLPYAAAVLVGAFFIGRLSPSSTTTSDRVEPSIVLTDSSSWKNDQVLTDFMVRIP